MTRRRDADLSRGVAIGSTYHRAPNEHVQPVRYRDGSGSFRLLMLPHVPGQSTGGRLLALAAAFVRHPLAIARAFTAWNMARKMSISMYMRTEEATLRLERAWHGGLTTRREAGEPPVASFPAATTLAREMCEVRIDLFAERAQIVARLGRVGWHANAAPAVVIGLDGAFEIRLAADRRWGGAREVYVEAGHRHELDRDGAAVRSASSREGTATGGSGLTGQPTTRRVSQEALAIQRAARVCSCRPHFPLAAVRRGDGCRGVRHSAPCRSPSRSLTRGCASSSTPAPS